MDALRDALYAVMTQKIFWVAFFQFLVVRPVLHTLPTIRLGHWALNLGVSSMLTMLALTALFALPLIIFDYIPLPRTPEIRMAYVGGMIAGGLLTHLLWAALVKCSILGAARS